MRCKNDSVSTHQWLSLSHVCQVDTAAATDVNFREFISGQASKRFEADLRKPKVPGLVTDQRSHGDALCDGVRRKSSWCTSPCFVLRRYPWML
eukprot:6461792-Amphidinium_carterae.1